MSLVNIEDIEAARKRIEGTVVHTPLLRFFGAKEGDNVFFKPETFQPVGSFKIRGSYNKTTKLVEEGFKGTIIAFSSGNHAQGAAYSARKHGLKAIIVMPNNCPAIKIKKTKAMGAEVVLYDPVKDSREQIAKDLAKEHNGALVPPYNDPDIIAGNGTSGLEIAEDMPNVELVLACIGGGGHISGIATGLKLKLPNTKVFGVEPELADDAKKSFDSGKIVENDDERAQQTIADGIRTHQLGDLAFEHIQKYVDGIVTVKDEEIMAAAKILYLDCKLVVEPTAAVPLAAYQFHRDELPEAKNIVIVLSGGSADPSFIRKISED